MSMVEKFKAQKSEKVSGKKKVILDKKNTLQ